MQLKKIALIGAGAIGSYFIESLTDKLGENLWIIADGERKERLETQGLIINEKGYKLNVKTPEEAQGADLLIVAVKYGSLPETLPQIKAIVDGHTLVISPLNGVDSEQIIGEVIAPEQILPSFMKIASQRVGNSIRFAAKSTPGLYFGELNGEITERINALEDLFAGTDFHYTLSDNILLDMWFKYALNISKNLPQAIINCGFGGYTTSEHLAFISKRMRDEVVAVAAAKGIDISNEDDPRGKNAAKMAAARFSTLQDLDAKRHTEIDMFSGALVRMGKELGIPTPFNEFAFHAIKCLEEKNDGILE